MSNSMHFGFDRVLSLLLTALVCAPILTRSAPALVPPVKEWRETGTRVSFASPVRLDARNQSVAQVLADEVRLEDRRVAFGHGRVPRILLGLTSDRAVARELAAQRLADEVPVQPESYLISVNPRGALLAARDETGLFYAAQTLRQLMRSEPGGISLPGGVVRDWPEMSFRGLSVDLAQGVIPTEKEMRQIIETCAEYKLNVVSFYMEHDVPFHSTPLMVPKDAELEPDTLRRLVAFSASNHVMLLPQQQMFGHLHHMLIQELYTHLGEVPHHTTLNVGDPEVYRWLEGVADELTPIFPGPLFLAGGDETVDLGKGSNREKAQGTNGVGKLWLEHMTRVADILRRHGRRTLFWGDMALKTPAVIPQLPRDMIAATWTYNADDPFANYVTPFRKAGLDVIVCPSVNNWSKPAPDFDVAVTNIGRFVAEGKRQGALGMLNTVWFDDGESLFDVVWYPVLYSAAAAWEGADVPRKEFDRAYDWAFYRAEGRAFADATGKLGQIHALARKAGLTDAANEYLWLDPYSGQGARVYSRLAPHVAQMRILAEEAAVAILENRGNCRLHTNTLDYLEFAARRMDWLGMKVQFCGEITAMYRDAREHVADSSRVFHDLEYIAGLDGHTADLRDMAGERKRQYRSLWLASSQPYFLEGVSALYDRELLYWLDKTTRVAEVRAQYRQTHTLPEPAAIGLSEP